MPERGKRLDLSREPSPLPSARRRDGPSSQAASAASSLSPALRQIQRLQSTAGNQATARLLGGDRQTRSETAEGTPRAQRQGPSGAAPQNGASAQIVEAEPPILMPPALDAPGPAEPASNDESMATEEPAASAEGDVDGALDTEQTEEASPESEPLVIASLDVDAASDDALATDEVAADGQGGAEIGQALSAWRARVDAATAAVPQPQLGSAREAPAHVRGGGAAMREVRQGARAGIPQEAAAAVSSPPEVADPPPPPPPDPVPSANALVEAWKDLRLPDQKMPDLVASPRGTQPTVATAVAVQETPGDESVSGAPTEAEAAAPESADQRHADAIRTCVAAEADTEQRGTAEGVTLSDVPPPEPAPLPAPMKGMFVQVLARLLADPGGQAQAILDGVREKAYADGALSRVYPEIGAALLPELTDSLTRELEAVREEAGIAGSDLEAAIEQRREQLAAEQQQACGDLGAAHSEENASRSNDADEELAEVAGGREAVDAQTESRLEAAQGEADPTVVELRRDRQVRKIDAFVARLRFTYDRARQRRHEQLDRGMQGQIEAYHRAAREDEQALLGEGGEPNATAARVEAASSRNWADGQILQLQRRVLDLKQEATDAANGYADGARDAGGEAAEMVRTWAAEQLGEQRGWWDKLWDLFKSWGEQATAESAHWEEARAGEARDALAGDLAALDAFVAAEGENVNLETNRAFQQLSEEQQAVVRTYYASPPGSRDSIGAVAAGLTTRLASQRRPGLLHRFQEELAAKPASEWEKLEELGKTESGGFSAASISDQLYQAMHGGITGLGTDEARIYSALGGLTAIQALAVRKAYESEHGENLDEDLKSELDEDDELVHAQALLAGDPALAAVAALHEAMSGPGTDEDAIMRTLRGKSEEERRRILAEYQRLYGVDLKSEIESELSDHELDRANALLEGDVSAADAIAVDQAMRGGVFGWGTDESAIEQVYKDIRADVAAEAARRGWTTAQMEAEIARRNANIEASYGARYGENWEPGDESALRQAFKSELSGPELDLTVALADNDLIRADAARLAVEQEGLFVTDDDVVNGVLARQYERSLEELRRDEWPAMQRQLDERARAEGWDAYRRRAEERKLERELEQRARERSRGYMGQLEESFDSQYSRWGAGGLQTLIAFNLSGEDQDKARKLVEQGGYLTPAQQIHFAVEGVGTNEEELKRALAGRSPEEIEEIRAEWRRLHPGEELDERIDSETSGRDNFDTRMLLRGEPRNADEEIEQMRERTRWELDNSAGFLSGHQREVLERRAARVEESYRAINDPHASPEERRRAIDKFQSRARGVDSAITVYREQVDSATDTLATVAAVTAAVVVGVIATVFTGGAAAAAIGALAGVLAQMVTKRAMLGGAYGMEDFAVDAVVGAIDIAAAYLTFGVGAALLKAEKAGRLARLAASPAMFKRMLAHALAEGAEGLVSSVPSALMGNVLNDQNWEKGNPLANIALGTLVETGIGTMVGAGIGSLGGIRAPAADVPRTGDVLGHRGTPQQRLEAWHQYKLENPDASMRDFLRDFDDGVAMRLANEDAARLQQRELRRELLSGIPPADRKRFAGAAVDVMPENEFRALTRSESGNAVILIENGQPRVILREGADPKVLREEGLHLLQFDDPRTRGAVRSLDERRLGDWHNLDIDEQLDLYRTKVELEIDAQHRLIRSLDEDLAAAGDDIDLRRSLRDQRGDAELSLHNLRRRLDEVDAISPRERLAVSKGELPRPQYLEQEPRLFNKKGKPDIDRPARADPDLPRRKVDDSPLAGKTEPRQDVYQIGHEWTEPKVDPNTGKEVQRTYRQVEVLDETGRVKQVREEIRLEPDGGWVQRGSESNRAGAIAESASDMITLRKKAAAAEGTFASLDTRYEGGKGFDGLEIEFEKGKATINVVEVKDYPNRYVPKSEFTAVADNLDNNLQRLREQLTPPRTELALNAAAAFEKRAKELGLSVDQLEAAIDALDEGRVTLEIRLGPSTNLGAYERGSVLKEIEELWRSLDLMQVKRTPGEPPIKVTRMEEDLLHEAAADLVKRDRLGSRPRFYRLATTPSGTLTPTSLNNARVVMLAEQANAVSPPVTRDGPDVPFVDADGKLLGIRSVQPGEMEGERLNRLARAVVDDLQRRVSRPDGKGTGLRTMLLDTSRLTPAERERLMRRIDRVLRDRKVERRTSERLHQIRRQI